MDYYTITSEYETSRYRSNSNIIIEATYSMRKNSILSAMLLSWGPSWNTVGSFCIPRDAASNLCTMTSAGKETSQVKQQ